MFSPSILLAYLALFLLGLVDNIRGPFYPYILDNFQLTKSIASWLFTLSSVTGLLSSILSPWWLKYIRPVSALKISILLHSLSLLFMGLGVDILNFYVLLSSSITLGLAMGIQGVCVNTIIAQEVSNKNSRRLFSGLHSMYGLASLLSPLLFGIILKSQFAIESLFYFLGMLTLLMFFYFLRTPKLKNTKEIKNIDFNFKDKNIYIYGTLMCTYVCFEILISSRLSLVLKESFSFSLDSSSFYLSLFFIGLLAGRLFFSFVHLNIKALSLLKISAYTNLTLLILGLYLEERLLPLTGLACSFFFPSALDYLKKNIKESELLITKIMILVSLSLSILHPLFSYFSGLYGAFDAMHLGFGFIFIVLYILHFKVDELDNIS